MMNRGLWRSLLVLGLLFAFTGSAYAQGMGSIFGKVTDASGAVMPGVTVTVTGPALQAPRVAVTTETGAYQFPNIPIGTYTSSFRASRRRRVRTFRSLSASTPASISRSKSGG
jgi:hypothetical protein